MSESTDPSPSGGRRSVYDRITGWLLELPGPGVDERERRVWFETTWLASTVQSFVVLWALAVVAWLAPPVAVPYLVAVWVAFVIPELISLVHPARRQVRLADASRPPTKGAVIVALVIFWVPCAVFLVGVTVGLDIRTGGFPSEGSLERGVVGALIGVVLALVGVALLERIYRRLVPPVPDASRGPQPDDG